MQQLLGNSGLWGIISPSIIVYLGSTWTLFFVNIVGPIAKLAISSVCSCDSNLSDLSDLG